MNEHVVEVRPAVDADLDDVLAMARDFYAAAGLGKVSPRNDDYLGALLCTCMLEDGRALIVATVDAKPSGFILLTTSPHSLCPDAQVAHELAWYIRPDCRGHGLGSRLLSAAEAWAKEQGAQALYMVALGASEPQKVGRVYINKGYRLLETIYARSLQ